LLVCFTYGLYFTRVLIIQKVFKVFLRMLFYQCHISAIVFQKKWLKNLNNKQDGNFKCFKVNRTICLIYSNLSMKRFIGIVPTQEIYSIVSKIQNRFGDNRLEPHITLIAPVTVIDEDSWITTIKNICATHSPIDIQLPTTGTFGKKTLFIDVSSEQLSHLYYRLNNDIKPYQKSERNMNENNKYHPHLTLGRAWCGFTKEDFVNMGALANDYLSKDPVAFTASFVRIYHKPLPKGRWEGLQDVPFGKEDKEKRLG